MDRNGWSGTRLAREMGTSQPWVSMVLSGKRDPGIRRSADLLARAGWKLRLVPTEGESVDRRLFLAAAASAALVPAAAASPYSSPDYLDGIAGRLACNEAQLGGAPLAREAARHAARAVGAAEAAGQSGQAAASRLLRQCALVLHDVRQLGRAEQAAGAALRLARAADDIAGQVQALDTLSLITAHQRDGRGAEYARRGLALPGTDHGRAILAARLGRALALRPGSAREAHRWLDHALALQGGEDAEVCGNCGIGFTDAGMPGRGEPYLAAAVARTAPSPFTHSLYVARQAKTAMRARQPERAAQAMTALAALAPLVESPRLAIHLRHVYDGTRQWDGIWDVRHAREALREAMT